MYSRLLVPLDGSATAELALHHAAALARLSGATLVLLHVIEEMKHCNGFERPQVYVEQAPPARTAPPPDCARPAASPAKRAARA